jgi:hypothetical protein
MKRFEFMRTVSTLLLVLSLTSLSSGFSPLNLQRHTTSAPSLTASKHVYIKKIALELSTARDTVDAADKKPSLKARLVNAGRGGLLAYGILNALYYCSVTALTYTYFFNGDVLAISSGVVGSARIAAAVKAMGKVVAIVWAGSQVTKALRISLALVSAPFVEIHILQRYGDNSGKVFSLLCRSLLGFTLIFYAVLVAVTAFKPG